jgi:hypothetical protein
LELSKTNQICFQTIKEPNRKLEKKRKNKIKTEQPLGRPGAAAQ